MPKWDKIRLENCIYAQAAKEGAALMGRNGALVCAGAGGLLKELLKVYNRFFSSQNRRFLRKTLQQQRAAYAACVRQYMADKQRWAVKKSFCLDCKEPSGGALYLPANGPGQNVCVWCHPCRRVRRKEAVPPEK